MAELLVDERAQRGIEPLAHPEHVAALIVALFRGISLMRSLDGAEEDPSFLETVVGFLAQALLPPPAAHLKTFR